MSVKFRMERNSVLFPTCAQISSVQPSTEYGRVGDLRPSNPAPTQTHIVTVCPTNIPTIAPCKKVDHCCKFGKN